MGFTKLKSLQVDANTTAKFTLDAVGDIGGGHPPVLVVRHAGESNAAYWNAVLKHANDTRNRAGGRITKSSLEEDRTFEAKLFAKHVVTGWQFVHEDDGKGGTRPVDFDSLKCEEFLLELVASAPDIYKLLRAFVADPDSFRTSQSIDGVALGKP